MKPNGNPSHPITTPAGEPPPSDPRQAARHPPSLNSSNIGRYQKLNNANPSRTSGGAAAGSRPSGDTASSSSAAVGEVFGWEAPGAATEIVVRSHPIRIASGSGGSQAVLTIGGGPGPTFVTFNQEIACWKCGRRLGHSPNECWLEGRCTKCGSRHHAATSCQGSTIYFESQLPD